MFQKRSTLEEQTTGSPSLSCCSGKKCWTPIYFSTLACFIRLSTFKKCESPKTEKLLIARNSCLRSWLFVQFSMGLYLGMWYLHDSSQYVTFDLGTLVWYEIREQNLIKSAALTLHVPFEPQKVVFLSSYGKLMLKFKLFACMAIG